MNTFRKSWRQMFQLQLFSIETFSPGIKWNALGCLVLPQNKKILIFKGIHSCLSSFTFNSSFFVKELDSSLGLQFAGWARHHNATTSVLLFKLRKNYHLDRAIFPLI